MREFSAARRCVAHKLLLAPKIWRILILPGLSLIIGIAPRALHVCDVLRQLSFEVHAPMSAIFVQRVQSSCQEVPSWPPWEFAGAGSGRLTLMKVNPSPCRERAKRDRRSD